MCRSAWQAGKAEEVEGGGGIPHAVEAGAGRAEHRQSLQRTTILWRHSSICQTCFVIIKWKMLHFHVRQAQDGAGDESEDGAENVAEAIAEAD